MINVFIVLSTVYKLHPIVKQGYTPTDKTEIDE